MDEFDEEYEEDGIPWCWKYVALAIINPLIGGLCMNFVWGALSLHWAENGWPAWRLGLLSMTVFQLRTPVVQLLVSTGLWMTIVFVLVSLLVMLPSMFVPQSEWAVAVLVICEAFETYVLYDSVSFVSFAETEKMAQQASAHTLQYFTLAAALSPTVGGFVYLLFGWQGIAVLGAAAKLLQLLVLATDKTVQGQVLNVMLYLSWRRDDDSDDLFDEDIEPSELPEPTLEKSSLRQSGSEEAEAQMPPALSPPALPPPALPPPALPGIPQNPQRFKTEVAFEVPLEEATVSIPVEQPESAEGSLAKSPRQSEQEATEVRLPAAIPSIPEDSRQFQAEVALEDEAKVPRASRKSRHTQRRSQASRMSQSPGMRGSRVSRTSWMTAIDAQSRNSTRMSRKSLCSTASNVSRMTAAAFKDYALAQVNAPAGSLVQTALPLLDEPDEDGTTPPVKIPSYIKLPLLAIVSVSFAGMFALSMSTLVASVVFQDLFGLNAAVSGAIRSAGGVLAVVGMALVPGVASDEEVFARNTAWKLSATVLCKPYKLSAIVAFWCVLSLGMAAPNVFLASAAHLLMGVAIALTNRAVSEMNLFFSLGDGGVFLKMQVVRSFSDAFGGGLACLLGPIIYEGFGAQGPFLVGAAMSFVVFVFYVVTFCGRVGWGISLEDAEAGRAHRLGIVRKILWKTKSKLPAEEPEE